MSRADRLVGVLLFITGVLTGVIVGFILSKIFGRSRPAGNTGDLGLLEERLGQANEGLGKFSLQLEAQNADQLTSLFCHPCADR